MNKPLQKPLQKALAINNFIKNESFFNSNTRAEPQRKQVPSEGYNPIMLRIFTINSFLLEGMNDKNLDNFILKTNPNIQEFNESNLGTQTERYKKMFRHMSKIDVLHVDEDYVEAFLENIKFKMKEILPYHPGCYELILDNDKNKPDAFQVLKDMIPKRSWTQWYNRSDRADEEDSKNVLRAVEREEGAEFRDDVYDKAEKAAELDKGGKKSKIAKNHKASKKRRASKKRKTKTSRK
jgi:hypothetical protein